MTRVARCNHKIRVRDRRVGGGGTVSVRDTTEARVCSHAGKEPQTKECRWPLEARRGKDTNVPPAASRKNQFQLQPSETHFRLQTPGATIHLDCCMLLPFVLGPQQPQGMKTVPAQPFSAGVSLLNHRTQKIIQITIFPSLKDSI